MVTLSIAASFVAFFGGRRASQWFEIAYQLFTPRIESNTSILPALIAVADAGWTR